MEPISRRSFITGACALVALGGLGQIPAAASTSIKKLPNGRLSVDVAKIPELAKVGGSIRIGNIKGKPVAITRTGANKYTAFSLLCPHQGVTVGKSSTGWKCDAHGSEFEANGNLVFGPATTGLAKVPIKLSKGIAVVG